MQCENPRFICDDHCGRLARWLRFLGFDCLHDQAASDARLLRQSAEEDRVILTRDRRLATKVLARQVILLVSPDPLIQLREVFEALGRCLEHGQILTRCTVCNQRTEAVEASTFNNRIPPYVRLTQTEFMLCSSCRRIYWKGTHVERMIERLKLAGLID